MFSIKPISPESILSALSKAERYRLLNEPAQAESICLDVLAIDPENQQALVMLLLSLTEQFRGGVSEYLAAAKSVIPRLQGEYEKLYYHGIVLERYGHARAIRGGPGSGHIAFDLMRQAMDYYQRAESHRPSGNDDAILRWNTCVRLCERYHLTPEPTEDTDEPVVGDD